ncbi:MAG: CHAD domain-containing protein, partial [Gaiellales bacterium]
MGRAPRETVERELKLAAGDRFSLPDLPGDRLEPRTLTSTYHDTPDLRLAAGGITLRHRSTDETGVWQLKLPHGDARLELEIPGNGATAPGELITLVTAHARSEPLGRVATLRTQRSGIRVRGIDGPLADVVVDSVTALDGPRMIGKFTEIEIELLDDNEDHVLERLARRLEQAGATPTDGRPKLFQVLDVRRTEPASAPDRQAPLAAHFAALLRVQRDAVVVHDAGTRLGRDAEELHQMRVATRRLRALLRSSRPILEETWAEGLRAELTWLGQSLGPTRDLDVLLGDLGAGAAGLDTSIRPAFEQLLDRRGDVLRRRVLGQLEDEAAHRRVALEVALDLAVRVQRKMGGEPVVKGGRTVGRQPGQLPL